MPHPACNTRWSALLLIGLCLATHADDELPAAPPDSGVLRVLLAAELETTLSSQMNGTLGELQASLGQKVAKSALLTRFNCSEAQARLKVAVAELAMARQNLDAKQHLRQLNAVGDLEVATATTEVQKADGARAMGQAQNDYCQVLAPFSGRVVKVYVKPYQTVTAGTPLFDLVSDGALKVRLNVPSTLMPKLKTGVALQVTIHETGKTYPAHIIAINSRVDAVAQTIELVARLDEQFPELMAGMSGTAQFSEAKSSDSEKAKVSDSGKVKNSDEHE